MKRPKKAKPIVEKIVVDKITIVCPHCHTHLRGGDLLKSTLRFLCWSCENPIDIDWDKK